MNWTLPDILITIILVLLIMAVLGVGHTAGLSTLSVPVLVFLLVIITIFKNRF